MNIGFVKLIGIVYYARSQNSLLKVSFYGFGQELLVLNLELKQIAFEYVIKSLAL